jgi:hypothetical protein
MVQVLEDAVRAVPGLESWCRIGLLEYAATSGEPIDTILEWASEALPDDARLAVSEGGSSAMDTFVVLEVGGVEEARLRRGTRLFRLDPTIQRVVGIP